MFEKSESIYLPSMGNTVARSDEKKEMILRHAARVFARYGYVKTTLEDIGRESHLNKASVYYYYKSKEDIYAAVVQDEFNRFYSGTRALCLKKKGVQHRILFFLQQRLQVQPGVLNLHQLSIETLRSPESHFSRLYSEFLHLDTLFVKELLDEGIRAREIRKTDTKRMAGILITFCDAIKHQAVRTSGVRFASEAEFTEAGKDIQLAVAAVLGGILNHEKK